MDNTAIQWCTLQDLICGETDSALLVEAAKNLREYKNTSKGKAFRKNLGTYAKAVRVFLNDVRSSTPKKAQGLVLVHHLGMRYNHCEDYEFTTRFRLYSKEAICTLFSTIAAWEKIELCALEKKHPMKQSFYDLSAADILNLSLHKTMPQSIEWNTSDLPEILGVELIRPFNSLDLAAAFITAFIVGELNARNVRPKPEEDEDPNFYSSYREDPEVIKFRRDLHFLQWGCLYDRLHNYLEVKKMYIYLLSTQ